MSDETPEPKRAPVVVHRNPWSRTVIAGVAGISGLTVIGVVLAWSVSAETAVIVGTLLGAVAGKIVTIVSVIAGRPGTPGATP